MREEYKIPYPPLRVNDRLIETTPDGFLTERGDWGPDVARSMAAQDSIDLNEQHWEIIEFVQSYYEEYRIVPIMRILAKAVGRKLGKDKGTSRYLYRLFPAGLVRQASRYAGLPKPPSCI